MGAGSLSILMHELLKLIFYAKCRDVVFLRLGTSGGLGGSTWARRCLTPASPSARH